MNDVTAIQSLPEPVHAWVLTAFTQAMDDLFLVAVPFPAVGLVIALLMREKPLGGAPATTEAREELVGAGRWASRHRSWRPGTTRCRAVARDRPVTVPTGSVRVRNGPASRHAAIRRSARPGGTLEVRVGWGTLAEPDVSCPSGPSATGDRRARVAAPSHHGRT